MVTVAWLVMLMWEVLLYWPSNTCTCLSVCCTTTTPSAMVVYIQAPLLHTLTMALIETVEHKRDIMRVKVKIELLILLVAE